MRFGLILGDQLNHQLATLKYLNRNEDVILMAEVLEETSYVAHHPQKIALIFSAMRHFAKVSRLYCFAAATLLGEYSRHYPMW